MIQRPSRARPITGFRGDYRFLSNFYPAVVTVNGLRYPTSEHAFQAQKSLELHDRVRVAACAGPQEAKRAGQQLTLRPDWEQVKKRAMLEVVLAKFTQNSGLATLLTATGGALLAETNTWHDQFWGDCDCRRPQCAEPGLNYLGLTLMAVRMIVREDPSR